MEQRKKDHIDLAFKTQTSAVEKDHRFQYEPMLSSHPADKLPESKLGGKIMKAPIWISSMTGGTKLGNKINHNLARVAGEFGLGMGLGSCNILLKNEKHLPDFDVRGTIGNDQPLYANMGIAQIEYYLERNDLQTIHDLLKTLRADGLVIHVNPMQEWLQPEGDKINSVPLKTIKTFMEDADYPIIVKEVGQGMGKNSLAELLSLNLEAIEFAAFGGTNFARVELERNENASAKLLEPLSYIGQTADEMTNMVNEMVEKNLSINTKGLIVSGGLKTFLDAYYHIQKSKIPAIYGMASTFLKYAKEDYDQLRDFTNSQIEGLKMAYAFLRINE